jgi:hypothetical protein
MERLRAAAGARAERRRGRWAALAVLGIAALPAPALAYSVLTHEAIVDGLWVDAIQPALLRHFPGAGAAELEGARAYAYGGCVIQDLGYYPFGSHFFSDLTHYVRSADFIQALLDESHDVNEYAFALGAVAHYGADIDGHAIAVNRAVPLLYPKLRLKFGDDVTYADNPAAHLKTEFGFDVLQVARGHYAPAKYHEFIGFQVSKDLLDRAFLKTYGLEIKDVFFDLDLALGTYRFSVSRLMPSVTNVAWSLKRTEILKDRPGVSRRQFVYNIKRANFESEWGPKYARPGCGARFLALLFRLMPRVGPLRGFGFKVPTPQTEKMFEDSFDAAVKRDSAYFGEAAAGDLKVSNRDLDTGNSVHQGEYALTDRTYDKLLVKQAEKKFAGLTPELRANILGFYGRMKTPDPHGIDAQLAALRAWAPAQP